MKTSVYSGLLVVSDDVFGGEGRGDYMENWRKATECIERKPFPIKVKLLKLFLAIRIIIAGSDGERRVLLLG